MSRESTGGGPGATGRLISRRDVLATGMLAGGAALAAGRAASAQALATASPRGAGTAKPPESPGQPGRDYTPIVVPNGWTLPWTVVDGVKVFHLVVEEVDHEFAPGFRATCWGYNGSVHGPVIEAVEGDRVRIFVTNRLGAPTTVHWHGVILENGMDGVGGLTQAAIRADETFMYEFTLRQHGTLMYHSHHDEMTQMGMGLTGMIVIHPRSPNGPRPDRDFAIMLHEWKVPVGASRPDPNEMTEFNILTMNGRVFPGTAPLVARVGDRVRIRLGNLSAMDHHPIHLHGYYFTVTETDGGVIPEAGRWPETTVLVPTGSTRTVEFIADNPGDWAMHCHMTHHVMTQMGHDVPNLNGVDPTRFDRLLAQVLPDFPHLPELSRQPRPDLDAEPLPKNSQPMVGGTAGFGYVTMGGMVTVLKVRDGIASYGDPGWYQHPEGTVAGPATAAELQRDGIGS